MNTTPESCDLDAGTLDPKDWDAFSELAHEMLDTMLGHMRSLHDAPAWQESPDSIRRSILDEPLPMAGQGEEPVFQEFLHHVLPYGNGNAGPRFFGWVQGCGTPYGMLSDMLASGMNPHLAGCNQNPVAVEQKVVEWLREIMGFPLGTSGVLVSGASMANLTALIVARNTMAGFDIRKEGLQGDSGQLMTVYGSTETHSWAKKAVEVLGLGDGAFRRIAAHADFTIRVEALKEAIDRDRTAGHRPIVVLATAGTVNTGATDDLPALADLCEKEGLWLHVDGAFGALAALSPKLKHTVAGLERADSLGFDLHKWMYLPFEIACVLIRDGEAHRKSFSQNVNYIAPLERGTIAGGLPFADMGIELTRGFKALKAWMSIKAYGVSKFAALIEQNVEQTKYLADRIRDAKDLELMAPVPLNVVCFRWVEAGLNLDQLNELNRELLLRIQERGLAVPSSTVLNGAFCLRACIVNHRTRQEDVDALIDAAKTIGTKILSDWKFCGRFA